jgi:DNA polymerase-3 subunit alpha
MRQADFVHLHVHSVYSLLHSTIRLPQLLERAKAYRLPALALTDHGNLFGAIEFYDQAYALGIKPILGCELGVDDGQAAEAGDTRTSRRAGHVVLLAKNRRGYENLLKLLTHAHRPGWQNEPAVPRSRLFDHHQGLILLSGCRRGDLTGPLLADDPERARARAAGYREVFGKDGFFVELQPALGDAHRRLNGELVKLGRAMDVQLVATANSHLLDTAEVELLRILTALRRGLTLEEIPSLPVLAFPAPEIMKAGFSHLPGAISNTLAIAERCNVDLELGRIHLPRFPLPQGEGAQEALTEQARVGLRERLAQGGAAPHRYSQRLEHELAVIERLKLADYFLIVADFIGFARKNAIPVGPGSGAAAASLTAFALGITEIDPVEQDLLFEHLVNPLHPEMPDLDPSFATERRDEVYRYLCRTYGPDRVARIVALGTIQMRSAIRDLGKVLTPQPDVEDHDDTDAPPGRSPSEAPHLSRDRLLRLGTAIEGLPRHVTTHTTGVVIGDGPLIEKVPLFRDSQDEWVSQYDMRALERVGLVKFDLLPSKTLSVMASIPGASGAAAPEVLPWKDEAAYSLLGEGRTAGLPYLDTETARALLVARKPRTWGELLRVVALSRRETGVSETLSEERDGSTRAGVTKIGPQPDALLFDGDATRLIAHTTGWTLERADALRRALMRHGAEEREELRQSFLAAAEARGHAAKETDAVWSCLERETPLTQNKSELAGRAQLALQAAALKARAPQHFLAALLSSELRQLDLLEEHVGACRAEGFALLPLHINMSEVEFTVEGDALRVGLAAVRHVSETTAAAIVRARREGGPFRSLAELCARVEREFLGRRALEALIKAGALDCLGTGRKRLVSLLPDIMDEARSGQMALFEARPEDGPAAEAVGGEPEWSELEKLAHEKEALGFSLSAHPLSEYRALLEQLSPGGTAQIGRLHQGARARVGGVIRSVREGRSRKNEPLHFVGLEDFSGSLDVVVFADILAGFGKELERGAAILVAGRVTIDADRVRMVADDMVPLDEAAVGLATSVGLHLHTQGLSRERLERLEKVIRAHPGRCGLFLHLHLGQQTEVVQRLPETFAVRPGRAFQDDLRKELGEVRLEVRYGEEAGTE